MSIRLATKALRDALEGAEPKLHTGADAAALVKELALTEKVCAAARARFAARVEECGTHRDEGYSRPSDWMAKQTGVDPARARREIETAKAAVQHAGVNEALANGEVSLDEAAEVMSSPEDARDELLDVAKKHDHRKLKARARRRRQEADRGSVADKRKAARHLRTWTDDLGMVQSRPSGPAMCAYRALRDPRRSTHTVSGDRPVGGRMSSVRASSRHARLLGTHTGPAPGGGGDWWWCSTRSGTRPTSPAWVPSITSP